MALTARGTPHAGKIIRSSFLAKMLFASLVIMLLIPQQSSATHFRYGNVTWTRVNDSTVTFHITQAWRRSFAWNTTPLVGGLPVFTGNFFFGDSTQAPMNVNVTAVNITENWFYGVANITHTYSGPGPWVAYFGSCCRISSLQNNFDGNFRVETHVDLSVHNSSPQSALQPIVNLPTGLAAASFTIPASDPNKDMLTFSLSLPGEMGDPTLTQPPGLAIDSATGMVTWNTIGRAVGEMWNASVRISDGQGGIVTLDFLINIVAQSNPPYFNYAVTPFDGQVFELQPGSTLTFPVQALDDDSGDVVTLQAFGLPLGSQMTPALPLNGNPVNSIFSWTPTPAQLRLRVVTFMAQDLTGNQTLTSVTINVTWNPLFDSPPTPANGSGFCIKTGELYETVIQAHAPDSLTALQIDSAVIPAGANLTPSIPTPLGNVTATTFSWMPTPADWGPHALSFSATDENRQSVTTNFSLVVNTSTQFTSLPPVLSVAENEPFLYNITAFDPDVPFGDELAVIGIQIPAWLILTDNGDGTAVLSGTPSASDVGSHFVHLDAEDIYHHCFDHASQLFTIQVTPCIASAAIVANPHSVKAYCAGQSIALTATAGDSYLWSTDDTSQIIQVIANGTSFYSVTVTTGNCFATASISIVARPNDPPRAICKNALLNLDSAGFARITAADIDGGSFDLCSPINRTVSASLFTCSNIGANAVTLTVTDVQGLSSTCQATVTIVGQTSACTATTSIKTIYLGYGDQKAILSSSADSTSTYSWSPAAGLSCTNCASPVFAPVAEGMYTFSVTVTSRSGCPSVCSVTICVLDIRVPGTDGSKIYVCHALPGNRVNSLTLALSINAVGSHIPGHIDDTYGRCDQYCAFSAKGSEEEIGELLTDGHGDGLQVIFYPNPFNNQFQLRIESDNADPVQVRVFDITGKLVYETLTHSPDRELTLGDGLAGGIYFTEVIQGESRRKMRIVKAE